MKKVTLLMCTLLTSLYLLAQPGGNGNPGGRPLPPSIGHVYGKLTDVTGKPIADASVRAKDYACWEFAPDYSA